MLKRTYKLIAMMLLIGVNAIATTTIPKEEERINLNYEFKIGITPIAWYGEKRYSERFKNMVDYGFEFYHQGIKNSLGLGFEGKNEKEPQFIPNLDEIYTYFVVGKRKVGNFSLVVRLGGASPVGYKTSYYGAFGIEKRIEKLNIQLLGEILRLKNDTIEEKYPMIGLKIGYVFGKSFEETMPQKPPVEQPKEVIVEKVEEVKPITITVESEELSEEVASGFDAYEVELSPKDKERVIQFAEKVNKTKKNGVVELRGYSDNSGSKELNVELTNERINAVEDELVQNGINNIYRIDPAETVGEYKVSNDTIENRRKNRRVEATFIENNQNYEEVQNVENNQNNIEIQESTMNSENV